jgi:hypothetical protein
MVEYGEKPEQADSKANVAEELPHKAGQEGDTAQMAVEPRLLEKSNWALHDCPGVLESLAERKTRPD